MYAFVCVEMRGAEVATIGVSASIVSGVLDDVQVGSAEQVAGVGKTHNRYWQYQMVGVHIHIYVHTHICECLDSRVCYDTMCEYLDRV